MKKRIIIISIIIVLVAVLLIIIFRFAKGKRYDVTVTSYDGKTEFTLKGLAKNEPTESVYYMDGIDFYVKNKREVIRAVTHHEGYLYAFTKKGVRTEPKNAQGFLFIENGRYFVLKYINGEPNGKYFISTNDNHMMLMELRTVIKDYPYKGYAILPIASWFARELEPDGTYSIDWMYACGIHSFEDMVEFYERTDSRFYEVDYENRMIKVYMDVAEIKGAEFYKDVAEIKGTEFHKSESKYYPLYICPEEDGGGFDFAPCWSKEE